MTAVDLIEDAAALEGLREEWDGLAVACARPGSAPALLLAWWRHLAPPDARPRVVTVRDGGRLVGLAPFLVQRATAGRAMLRLFGTPSLPQRSSILAAPGHEPDVWPAIAGALARSDPRPAAMSLERIDAAAAWPRALAESWPGSRGARVLPTFQVAGQVLSMRAGSFDAWMAGRSQHARYDVRSIARRVAKNGARIVRAEDPETLARGLDAYARLHGRKWGDRSRLWQPEAMAMLREAGDGQLETRRMRLYLLEDDDRIHAALIIFAAGGEAVWWNSGWDPDSSRLRPVMAMLHVAIEDCFDYGDRRLDMGEGEQPFKLRLADGEDPLGWATLLPRGPAYPLMRAATAPERLRGRARLAARRLPPGAQRRLRDVRRRLGGGEPVSDEGRAGGT